MAQMSAVYWEMLKAASLADLKEILRADLTADSKDGNSVGEMVTKLVLIEVEEMAMKSVACSVARWVVDWAVVSAAQTVENSAAKLAGQMADLKVEKKVFAMAVSMVGN